MAKILLIEINSLLNCILLKEKLFQTQPNIVEVPPWKLEGAKRFST